MLNYSSCVMCVGCAWRISPQLPLPGVDSPALCKSSVLIRICCYCEMMLTFSMADFLNFITIITYTLSANLKEALFFEQRVSTKILPHFTVLNTCAHTRPRARP